MEYDVLESKSLCFLLNKNINLNRNETESKMENLTHTFRETILALQLIQESRIKSKTVMSWKERKKIAFFVIVILSEGNLYDMCFVSTYSVLNKLSKYIYFYISKNITSYTFLLLSKTLKSSKVFCVSLITDINWSISKRISSSSYSIVYKKC